MYRVFIKNCVFSLKFCDFSELCQFCCSAGVLPAWCVYTHWHRGKTEFGIFKKKIGKTQYLMNTLYMAQAFVRYWNIDFNRNHHGIDKGTCRTCWHLLRTKGTIHSLLYTLNINKAPQTINNAKILDFWVCLPWSVLSVRSALSSLSSILPPVTVHALRNWIYIDNQPTVLTCNLFYSFTISFSR